MVMMNQNIVTLPTNLGHGMRAFQEINVEDLIGWLSVVFNLTVNPIGFLEADLVIFPHFLHKQEHCLSQETHCLSDGGFFPWFQVH